MGWPVYVQGKAARQNGRFPADYFADSCFVVKKSSYHCPQAKKNRPVGRSCKCVSCYLPALPNTYRILIKNKDEANNKDDKNELGRN